MLLWRQKKFLKLFQNLLNNRTKFFAKFMACSCFFHVCAGLLLFFFHKEYRSDMSLKVHSTVQEATVRFFSFRKKRSSTSSPSQSVQNSSKKVKTQVTKSSVSQQTSKVKSVTKKEKSIVKSIQKQKQKSVVKKELSKGKEVQSQGVEQKKEQVGHREFNMLQLQEQIQEAVEGIWSAPPGCTETAECTVVITVGWDGKVLHTEVQKSSGILIYDISVEHAVPKIQFPHAAWGKTFTLVFKP